jgi:hypothetical protein
MRITTLLAGAPAALLAVSNVAFAIQVDLTSLCTYYSFRIQLFRLHFLALQPTAREVIRTCTDIPMQSIRSKRCELNCFRYDELLQWKHIWQYTWTAT